MSRITNLPSTIKLYILEACAETSPNTLSNLISTDRSFYEISKAHGILYKKLLARAAYPFLPEVLALWRFRNVPRTHNANEEFKLTKKQMNALLFPNIPAEEQLAKLSKEQVLSVLRTLHKIYWMAFYAFSDEDGSVSGLFEGAQAPSRLTLDLVTHNREWEHSWRLGRVIWHFLYACTVFVRDNWKSDWRVGVRPSFMAERLREAMRNVDGFCRDQSMFEDVLESDEEFLKFERGLYYFMKRRAANSYPVWIFLNYHSDPVFTKAEYIAEWFAGATHIDLVFRLLTRPKERCEEDPIGSNMFRMFSDMFTNMTVPRYYAHFYDERDIVYETGLDSDQIQDEEEKEFSDVESSDGSEADWSYSEDEGWQAEYTGQHSQACK